MTYPSFFDDLPTLLMHDPLAQFLGAAQDGLIEYSYADVVKLAGHSCPTVAGAYLMTIKALKHLYEDMPPERGNIKVEFRNDEAEGVTGVMANVVCFLTGAAGNAGFKGLGGRFVRRERLFFNVPMASPLRFERLDTGDRIGVEYQAGTVPPLPEMMPALQTALRKPGDPEQQERFGRLWQDRVRRIFEQAEHPDLIRLV